MRCAACDKLLTDLEASKKSKQTGEFFDMCTPCLASIADSVEVANDQSSAIWNDDNEGDLENDDQYYYETDEI